ncbi:MAG: hypothetical protein M3Y33_06815 [Actinomycetota bacterium]|nr:hypothetical protein [Actinomycetota bacterium]
MADLTPEARRLALAEIERMQQTLLDMCQWLDEHGETRAAIMAEDCAGAVAALGWQVERPHPGRLVHRRMPGSRMNGR